MPEYIVDPIETDPDDLQRAAFEYLQARWPDWRPEEGNLESWMIAACARMVAEARDTAADVPKAVFRYYGERVLGLPPIDATSATVASTWTLTTNPAGRTIEAGTLVGIEGKSEQIEAFEVVDDVALGVGVLVTGVGAVTLRSISEGEDYSDIGGAGVFVDPLDPIAWVTSVKLEAPTSGGRDAEDDDTYLDRLSARLTLLTPRPILPRDFELLAKDIAAQEGIRVRALALDGYDPVAGTFLNERYVSVAMVDDDTGLDVTPTLKALVGSDLDAMREVNFVVPMIDPTRTPVDVTWTGFSVPGADPVEVEAATEAAVNEFLLSVNWGQPSNDTEERMWLQTPVVRHQDVSAVLSRVPNFDRWTTLTIGLNGGAQVAADANLPGAAPLAQPGVIAGSISA